MRRAKHSGMKPKPKKRAIQIQVMPKVFDRVAVAAEENGRPVALEVLLRLEKSLETSA